MSLHWLDYVILGIIGLSVLTGLFRGFVKELIALCVWILAIWLAYRYSAVFEVWLQPYFQDKTARTVASFVAILLGTLIVGGVFNAMLSFILRRSGLSGTDRILGMGFGFVRGVFMVALMILVMQMTSLPYQKYSEQSRLYAKFTPVVHWLAGFVPQWIQQMKALDKNEELIDIKPAA